LQGGVTLWNRRFTSQEIWSLISDFSEREEAYVIDAESSIIGWGMIRLYHEKEGYARACETSVFLRREYINQGLGTPFKKFIIARCKELGYHHIHARIIATNEISIAYNMKLGYTIVGTQREIGYVDGKWVDVVIMQLLI
jgi:phosphinothricin acetyltransferase